VQRTSVAATSVEDYIAHLGGRLSALARVQEILMRDPSSYADLVEVLDDELLSQGVSRERVRVAGPSLMLDHTTAASLALALHELTTNAIKFGALSNADGRLSIGWGPSLDADGWSLLEWREQSSGHDDGTAVRPAFGFELIRKTLPYEIDAKTKIEVTPRGLECEIAFRTSTNNEERSADRRFGDYDT
jgi:two-component system CheB/CheR fusion protein